MKWERNYRSGSRFRLDAEYTILFSSPGTRLTEAWMCSQLVAKAISFSIVSNAEAVLTLPLLAHSCAAV